MEINFITVQCYEQNFVIFRKDCVMTKEQEQKIKQLIDKYNDILLISMKLAVTEDFVNLVLLNRDDSNFELRDLISDKKVFSDLVMKEFMRKNGSVVLEDLKKMEDPLMIKLRHRKS
jgi:hypothetical protein